MINEEKYKKLQNKIKEIEELKNLLKTNKITPTKETNEFLNSINSAQIKDGLSLYDLLRRPEVTMDTLKHFIEIPYNELVQEQVEISIKYEGYIKKAEKEAEKMLNLENKKIPEDIDYDKIHNLASEAKQKLKEVRPTSIGQAIRISGVNPADISIIMIYLKKEYNHEFK